ncbi:aspartic peptidase domain-containing protein [Mycena latifolia]|nr:aspartic peptidase domain-containing protein [Mycena latifolia]
MWISSLLFLLEAQSAFAVVVDAARPAARPLHPRTGASFASAGGQLTLDSSPHRYVTDITIDGETFKVAVDTGSSDLWIKRPSTIFLNDTGIPVEISFVTSSVNGTLAFGAVELGGYSFPQQAFVSATEIGLAEILDEGLDGLMGFAFDGIPQSQITVAVESAKMNPTAGQPFLFNIFDQNADVENFIAISLSRTGDLEGSADASFTVNEIDPAYPGILNSKPIQIFPPEKRRWSLTLDGVTVDGTPVPIPASTVQSVTPVAAGNLIILMDTGTPTASLPIDLFNAIYSRIPGAILSGPTGQFIVPCNTTTIVTVIMSGQSFPIHPLDLTDVRVVDGVTVCTSAMSPAAGNTDFDALFGDTIMRNIYTLFNFGSAIAKAPGGTSSMQLLSQTDPTSAKADVTNVRMAQLANNPPEGIPASFQPLTIVETPPTGTIAASLLESGASSNSTSTPDSLVSKYGPIIVGLLGANLLVVVVLAVIGLALCVKRGRKSRAPRYVPVKFREPGAVPRQSESYEDKRYSD